MENTILDHEETRAFGEQPTLKVASTGKRFANYIIDIIGFYIVAIVLAIVAEIVSPGKVDALQENTLGQYAVIYALLVVYYTVFEGSFNGKTPGKFITRTRAVTENGQPLTWKDAISRSLCRLIPFEPFTYLGNELGWHDTISHTMVIDERQSF